MTHIFVWTWQDVVGLIFYALIILTICIICIMDWWNGGD